MSSHRRGEIQRRKEANEKAIAMWLQSQEIFEATTNNPDEWVPEGM